MIDYHYLLTEQAVASRCSSINPTEWVAPSLGISLWEYFPLFQTSQFRPELTGIDGMRGTNGNALFSARRRPDAPASGNSRGPRYSSPTSKTPLPPLLLLLLTSPSLPPPPPHLLLLTASSSPPPHLLLHLLTSSSSPPLHLLFLVITSSLPCPPSQLLLSSSSSLSLFLIPSPHQQTSKVKEHLVVT